MLPAHMTKSLINFENKLNLIIENEDSIQEINAMRTENEILDYFINHFIMADMDVRQIRVFIINYGLKAFCNFVKIKLDEKLNYSVQPSRL